MTDREQLQRDHCTGVGASECHHVLNADERWSCRRQLWYRKRWLRFERRSDIGLNEDGGVYGIDLECGLPPDYPDEDKPWFERGRRLEPIAAEIFEERSVYRLVHPSEAFRHPTYPEILAHPDRIYGERGILEIKVVNQFTLRRWRREGLPAAYIVQLQHGMIADREPWTEGSFAVLSPESWEFESWRVEPDPVIQSRIVEEVPTFWREVLYGPAPDRLPPTKDGKLDARCGACQWRITCQGQEEIDKAVIAEPNTQFVRLDDVAPLAAAYSEARDLAGDAKDWQDECGNNLRKALGEVTAAKMPGYLAYYRPQETQRWDGKLLDAVIAQMERMAVADEGQNIERATMTMGWLTRLLNCRRPVMSRPLRVYRR